MVCPDLPRKELARFLLISRLVERREHFRPHLLYYCIHCAPTWPGRFGLEPPLRLILLWMYAGLFPFQFPAESHHPLGRQPCFILAYSCLAALTAMKRHLAYSGLNKRSSRVAHSASPRIRLLPTSSQRSCFSRFNLDDHRGPEDGSLRQLWKAELGGGRGGAWEDRCPMTPVCSWSPFCWPCSDIAFLCSP